MLVFKAVAGITDVSVPYYDPYDVWMSPTAINENNATAKLLDTSFRGHYKNLILDQHLSDIKQVSIILTNDQRCKDNIVQCVNLMTSFETGFPPRLKRHTTFIEDPMKNI